MLLLGLLFLALLQLIQHGKTQEPNFLPSAGVQLYLPYEDRIIPNYSMIYASQFYNVDQNNDPNNTNDALWCQSANTGSNIGMWYYPNGTEVPVFNGGFTDLSAPSPVFSKRYRGQIALARRLNLGGVEGFYKCVIPDENGINRVLVVAAYRRGTYTKNDGPDADSSMQFSFLSESRLATPPVFSLSFNVSDGPPTTVNCSLNGVEIFPKFSRVIVNGTESTTKVTIANLTEAGNYRCNVSNSRVTNGTINGITALSSTSSLTINVSGTPGDFKNERLNSGLAHVRLTWSPVPGATGYEVFYASSVNPPASIISTTIPSLSITSGLIPSTTYNFYVISYSRMSLPSNNSTTTVTFVPPLVNEMSTDTTSTTITLSWSPPVALAPSSYQISRGCRRICESVEPSHMSFNVSSPSHYSTGIIPYSYCSFDLVGFYGTEKQSLKNNFIVSTLTSTPSLSVSDISFSSVGAHSMNVSWDEVPCSGRNGPVTGYYLTYTDPNSNNDFTINITAGGDNRTWTLAGLAPYINYTVRISAYNYDQVGPTSPQVSQRTAQSVPGVITDLTVADIGIQFIRISWSPPTVPNGLITSYEIAYGEYNNAGPHDNIINTTNTHYTIEGLLPNTSYDINVRAYTNIGAGEWTSTPILFTSKIPVMSNFSVTQLNSTAVIVKWLPNRASHCRVYYFTDHCTLSFQTYPSSIEEVTIGGLCSCMSNTFSVSALFEINGRFYEGEKSQPISPVKVNSTSKSSSTLSTSTSISSATETITTESTATPSSDIISATTIGLGVSSLLLIISLIFNIILVLVVMLLCRKAFFNEERKEITPVVDAISRFDSETDIYIEMKASPAYDKSLVKADPIYETANEIIYETTS